MHAVRMIGNALCLLLAWQGLAVAAPAVRLASEEWPPFVSSALPDNGLSGAYTAAVFARLGSVSSIDYFPWKRTMELGMNDPHYAGLLAVWRTPQRETQCHFSTPVGTTMNVLAYLKDAPVNASTLRELREASIGIVAGYSNGEDRWPGAARRVACAGRCQRRNQSAQAAWQTLRGDGDREARAAPPACQSPFHSR
jgi:polar amino acid transport system substrate-binding protein